MLIIFRYLYLFPLFVIFTNGFAQTQGIAKYSVEWLDRKELGDILHKDTCNLYFDNNLSVFLLHPINGLTNLKIIDNHNKNKGLSLANADYEALSVKLKSEGYNDFHTQDLPYNIFMNKSNNKLFHYIEFQPLGDTCVNNYLISEDIGLIDWEIIDESKIIQGLVCQKAVGWFRGRYYTVWFAPDIPVSFGPWKLNGLPGLIVFASDRESKVVLKLETIKTGDDLFKNAVLSYPSDIEKIELQDFIPQLIKNIKAQSDEQYQWLVSRMPRSIYVTSVNFLPFQFHIEKEYEFLK
ncbi:MAG: GLPGLI family protein [bacterium]